MADRKNYYFKQLVTESELDAGFDQLEVATRAMLADQLLTGIMQGAAAAEAGVPDLTIDVSGPAVIYDQLGQRIFWSPTQNVNCAVDELGNPTAVIGGGNARILSVFAEFDRALSDSRVDGNGATIFFDRSESFKINVVAGATVASGGEVAPALRVDQILICDITLITAQASIVNGDIDALTRREDVFVLTGTPNNERGGTPSGILQAFQVQINALLAGGAGSIGYAGGGNWADGTTNPATDVEAQLDKIITDLVANNGADRINVQATAGGVVTAGGSIQAALGELEAAQIQNVRSYYFGKRESNNGGGLSNSLRYVLTAASESENIELPHLVEGGRVLGFSVWGSLSAADHYSVRLMKVIGTSVSGVATQVGVLQTSPASTSGIQVLSHTLVTPADGDIVTGTRFFLQIQLLHDAGAGSLAINTCLAQVQDAL